MTTTDVSLDYFLFSVYETERTIRAVPDSVKTDKRWPTGLKLDEQSSEAETSEDFSRLMASMVAWYKEAFPKIMDVRELNLSNLADVIQPFAMMMRDIRLTVERKFSKDMPFLQDDDSDHIWYTVKKTLGQAFPDLNTWFSKYFEWSYNRPVTEEEDDGSRPPTGRFAPSMGRRSGSDRPSRPGGDRRPDRGERRDRPERGGDRKRSGGGEKKSFDRGPDERRPRAPRGEGRGERSNSDRAELEQQILQEVRTAAEELRSDSSKQEIKLRPVNSFFRHLQHSEIKEQGFFSKSAGEGNDRSVVIMRAPDGTR